MTLSEQQFFHHFSTSQIGPLGHLIRNAAPAPAPAGGTPDPIVLGNILNSVVKAPGSTSIATVSPNIAQPTPEMLQLTTLLTQIQTLDSYISILTAYCIYNAHPTPYDVTDSAQATEFACQVAKWRTYVITGGVVKAIAAYLSIGTVSSSHFSKSVTSATLHAEFLTAIFGGFGLATAALSELDSILTSVTNNLKTLSLEFSTTNQTLDHVVTYYYFETVQGTGTGSIPALFKVSLRLLNLKVAQSSWTASIGKSSAQNIQFSMDIFDTSLSMNSGAVANDQSNIDSTIQTLTGKTKNEVNNLMNMKAIHADPS